MVDKQDPKKILDKIDSLLVFGQIFMQISDSKIIFTTPPSISQLSMPLSMQKEKWLDTSVQCLIDNFPEMILAEDFHKIQEIRESLNKKPQILISEINEHIEHTALALLALKKFIIWLLSFNDTDLLYEQRAIQNYASLKAMHHFTSKNVFTPLLNFDRGRNANTLQ